MAIVIKHEICLNEIGTWEIAARAPTGLNNVAKRFAWSLRMMAIETQIEIKNILSSIGMTATRSVQSNAILIGLTTVLEIPIETWQIVAGI